LCTREVLISATLPVDGTSQIIATVTNAFYLCDFASAQYEHIAQMFQLTDDALTQMIALVKDVHQQVDVNKSFNIETEINNYRNQLKNQNVIDVNEKKYDYQMGVHYMDIIAECEKLGDYAVNVVEAHRDVKEKKA
jgi:phosphate:Na+ symporter